MEKTGRKSVAMRRMVPVRRPEAGEHQVVSRKAKRPAGLSARQWRNQRKAANRVSK